MDSEQYEPDAQPKPRKAKPINTLEQLEQAEKVGARLIVLPVAQLKELVAYVQASASWEINSWPKRIMEKLAKDWNEEK